MVTPKNKPSMAASLLVAFPVFFPFFSSATLSASANLLKSKNALSLSSAHQVLYLGLSYHRLGPFVFQWCDFYWALLHCDR
jgi:hypothetical protein